MSEGNLLKEIQVAVSTIGARLLRNNVGLGFSGKSKFYNHSAMVKVGPGDVVIRNARPVKFGLAVGSSDLIGWTPVIIKPEHVGKTFAVFTAVECKLPNGRLSQEQKNFLTIVQSCGGIAGVAFTVEQAFEVVHGF